VPDQLTNGTASNNQGVRRVVALAYVLAISIPPLGLILGIALCLRAGRRYLLHGIAVIVVSIIATVVWVLLLTSGGLSTTDTSY
jgi:hypothetical protein